VRLTERLAAEEAEAERLAAEEAEAERLAAEQAEGERLAAELRKLQRLASRDPTRTACSPLCSVPDFAVTAWRQGTTRLRVTYGYQVCEIGAHDPWGS